MVLYKFSNFMCYTHLVRKFGKLEIFELLLTQLDLYNIASRV